MTTITPKGGIALSKRKLSSPTTLLGPVPSALVSCGRAGGEKNIITLAWVGVVNSSPPMASISIRPSRHSHGIIKETGEFVINIPTADQVLVADRCGTVSGKKVDKFRQFNLTAIQGTLEHAPLIEECPLNLECRVRQTILLGSHEMFLGQVEQVYLSGQLLNGRGRIGAHPEWLGYLGGQYFSVKSLGLSLGYSLK
ncbi:MAG: flavin reductase family protein [Firmicutes bacterium]|nr:flavin reductase family protein [Bacillota bacterium]